MLLAREATRHFWRVEAPDGKRIVSAHELDPASRAYVSLGIFHHRPASTVPFAIDIDLTEIERM